MTHLYCVQWYNEPISHTYIFKILLKSIRYLSCYNIQKYLLKFKMYIKLIYARYLFKMLKYST